MGNGAMTDAIAEKQPLMTIEVDGKPRVRLYQILDFDKWEKNYRPPRGWRCSDLEQRYLKYRAKIIRRQGRAVRSFMQQYKKRRNGRNGRSAITRPK